MKTISSTLLAFLQTATSYNKADLFAITLQNGQFIYANNSGADIVFNGNTYFSSQFGAWQRGSVTQEAKYSPESNMIDLTVLAKPSVLYPGTSTSLMSTLNAGLFDGAIVKIFTIYWAIGALPQTGVAMGFITTFVGQIANTKQTGRSQVKFDVADLLYILNRPTPPNLIQSSCRHDLFDQNCALLSTPFLITTTCAAGSTTLVLVTAATLSSTQFNSLPYYSLGKVTFTSGQNAGLTFPIKSQLSTTQLQLGRPTPFPIVIGDGIQILPGCDKTLVACNQKFNNLIHNGSMPYVPSPEVAATIALFLLGSEVLMYLMKGIQTLFA